MGALANDSLLNYFLSTPIGDSMMYHNSSNTNGNCSGGGTGSSPNSTPPNINATTPPLSSQTSQSDGNGKFGDDLVLLTEFSFVNIFQQIILSEYESTVCK